MADRSRIREQAFSLPSSTVGVLHQSPLSSTRRFRRVIIINQHVVVHSIRHSKRRFVAHLSSILAVGCLSRGLNGIYRDIAFTTDREGNYNNRAYTLL